MIYTYICRVTGLGLLLMFVLSSCGPDYLYEERKQLPATGWVYTDTLDFAFEVQDTNRLYNMYLDFDFDRGFGNQNVYLRLSTRFPDGKRVQAIRSFNFFDDQGVPYGECSDAKCKGRSILQEKAFFNQSGKYTLTIEQYTRTDALSGISALGVAIERTEDFKTKK
jgi:gliding motility-associated lipoprotein GldH